MRLVAKLRKRHVDGIRIRLVDGTRVASDHRLHVDVHARVTQPALHHLVALACHDTQWMSPIVELLECVERAFIRGRQLVVMLSLIGSIPCNELTRLFVRFHEWPKLLGERSADACNPLFFSWSSAFAS